MKESDWVLTSDGSGRLPLSRSRYEATGGSRAGRPPPRLPRNWSAAAAAPRGARSLTMPMMVSNAWLGVGRADVKSELLP